MKWFVLLLLSQKKFCWIRVVGGAVLALLEPDPGSPGDPEELRSIDLGVPLGRAPKVLRRTGWGSLGYEQA